METLALEVDRLTHFSRLLGQHRRKHLRSAEIWRAFATAFPHRPAGPAERRLLMAALDSLQTQGVLRLPSPRGRRWDRAAQPAVPTAVELVKEVTPKASSDWRRFPWHPSLHWILDLKRLSAEQVRFLEQVHRGLVNGDFQEPAPLKYRSLQLTGREKQLASLARSALFGSGRLTLELLGCLSEALPLAWESVGEADAMLIFENAGPFAVACHVLGSMTDPPYGVVAYGAGRSVIAALGHLPKLKRTVHHIDYVGDLDARGLDILLGALERAAALGLPPVRPATRFHAAMVSAAAAFGARDGWPADETKPCGRSTDELVRVLNGAVAAQVKGILRQGRRIPEEVLGPREMRAVLDLP
jgi:hypothetical protein